MLQSMNVSAIPGGKASGVKMLTAPALQIATIEEHVTDPRRLRFASIVGPPTRGFHFKHGCLAGWALLVLTDAIMGFRSRRTLETAIAMMGGRVLAATLSAQHTGRS